MALLSRHQPSSEFDVLAYRLLRLGLLIGVAGPLAVCVAAYLIRGAQGDHALADFGGGVVEVAFYALLALSLSEIGAMWLIRRRLLCTVVGESRSAFDARMARGSIVLFAIGATPAVYGAVFFSVLGGTVRELVLFGLISLIAFRLFRPSPSALAALYSTEDQSDGSVPSGDAPSDH